MLPLIKLIFGSKNDRELKKIRPLVGKINECEAALQAKPDEFLRERTAEWKTRLSAIKDDAELRNALEDILPEAFAVVKNACRRMYDRKDKVLVREHEVVWDMIPFDVQLIGGAGLHRGCIAEMATGEGKTLVATLPVYLNALTGRGVHVVTVNDYLAARDCEWMGAVYRFLGLTVGCILHDQDPHERREQYNCDITYGTNAEFGFDYLRDNGMALRPEEQVQRGHYYAIVDEVDSILIDEARTPLIISGPSVLASDVEDYIKAKVQIESLVRQQERLCNRYLKEAEDLAKKLHPEGDAAPKDGDALEQEIGLLLYKVKLGQPRSENLARFLENPEYRRLMDKAELQLHADQKKVELYAQKEQLFFAMEEKSHEADLTEKGRNFLSPSDPDAFMIPDLITAYHEIDTGPEADVRKRLEMKTKVQADYEAKAQRIHVISQLLKAYCLYQLDVNYVIENGKVVIVDEHTGRAMYGRRWSEGLHQAVEAKEGVMVERETQTYATITIQNYFRLYAKLAGMTGTAETEATEFFDIYKLGVLVIPTNKPCIRRDSNDSVYKTRREKFNAVVQEIQLLHSVGRPILVGTIAVETSEMLSKMLSKAGIVHSVLNAKQHEREAEIVARAGQKGSVTIATNMAGRGTDIKLGPGVLFNVQCEPDPKKKGHRYTLTDIFSGEKQVVESDAPQARAFMLTPKSQVCGGLHVMGTERHESRRIDRQLRGRCARQGDPGSSHFYISLEDDLMRLFGSERIVKVMERVGLEEGQELEHPLLNRSIQQAQKRVEGHNFQIRKRTLEYDDVMNKQREVIYGFRNKIIYGTDVRDQLMDVMEEVVISQIEEFTVATTEPAAWQLRSLADWININFPIGVTEANLQKIAEEATEPPPAGSTFTGFSAHQYGLCGHIIDQVRKAYEVKLHYEDPEKLKSVERYTILSAIDKTWQEHLYHMDSLRNSIGLRAYGQRDPLIEYKVEAKKVFDEMMVNVKTEICMNIFRSATSMLAFENFLRNLPQTLVHGDVSGGAVVSSGGTTTSSSSGLPGAQRGSNASDIVSEAADSLSKAKPVRMGPKVGRNDPCPCGSGKKYKQCCGKL